MNLEHPIGRRSFFRLTGLSAALLAASQLRMADRAVAAPAAAGGRLRVFGPGDAEIFSALAERMTFSGASDMPAFRDTSGLAIVDAALLQLPSDQRQQLHYGLLGFEYLPLLMIRRFARFTRLSADDQDRYLAAWASSELEMCRLGFEAFKNLSMLGYYADERTWKGIHYAGPWVPRPRRPIAS